MIAFCKRWSWVAGVGLAAAFLFVVTFGRKRISVKREVAAAKAEQKAAYLEAEVGYDAAITEIERSYQDTIENLNTEQLAEAEELRKNPQQLSRWLAILADERQAS